MREAVIVASGILFLSFGILLGLALTAAAFCLFVFKSYVRPAIPWFQVIAVVETGWWNSSYG